MNAQAIKAAGRFPALTNRRTARPAAAAVGALRVVNGLKIHFKPSGDAAGIWREH